jgi:hypothetical protein
MRRPSRFKKTDVIRAPKAILAAGLEVARIATGKDGGIFVVPRAASKESEPESSGGRATPKLTGFLHDVSARFQADTGSSLSTATAVGSCWSRMARRAVGG